MTDRRRRGYLPVDEHQGSQGVRKLLVVGRPYLVAEISLDDGLCSDEVNARYRAICGPGIEGVNAPRSNRPWHTGTTGVHFAKVLKIECILKPGAIAY